MGRRRAQTAPKTEKTRARDQLPPEETFVPDIGDFELGPDCLDFELPEGLEIEEGFCLPDDRISRPVKMRDIPKHLIFPQNAADLVARGIVPPSDSLISCVVKGSFEFGDLIGELLLAHGGASECMVSTLSMSDENVEMFAAMLDNDLIPRLSLFVSDYFYSHNRRTIYKHIFDAMPLDRLQVTVAGLHTKIALLQLHTPDGDVPLCIEGSANLRSSQNVEQFAVVNSAQHYAFHRAWLSDLEEQYKTIGRKARYYGSGN